jgi:ABC-type lipoprotein export system ATPase subunit
MVRDSGTTVVMVTHDQDAAATADMVFTIVDGRLVSSHGGNDRKATLGKRRRWWRHTNSDR